MVRDICCARAHFGQHMNLSLGAAIGLLIALPSRAGRLRKRDWFVRAGLVFVIAAAPPRWCCREPERGPSGWLPVGC